MPEVSVIIPFYNAQDTIRNSVESIRTQTMPDFECILVDNNSTDHSNEMVRELIKNDSRFILAEEQQQGVCYASKKGSSLARGQYIARMDADDVAMPRRLELQVAFLNKNPGYGAVGGLVKFGGDTYKAAGLYRYVQWNNSLIDYNDIAINRFIESPVINPTAMWRKEAEQLGGSYRHGNYPEDYELWLRWLSKGIKIAKVPEYILQWNDSPGRLTRTHQRYSTAAFYHIKTQYLAQWLRLHNPHYPDVMIWGASRKLRKRADLLKEQGINITGYIDISKKRQINEPLVYYRDLPDPEKTFILIYMPHFDIKKEIILLLTQQGYIHGKHFICAA